MSLSRSYKKFIKVISRLNLYNNSSNKGINSLFVNHPLLLIQNNYIIHIFLYLNIF